MKKCPQCAQVYGDDLNFCLNDGATLVNEAFQTQSETPTVLAGGFSVPTQTQPPVQPTFQIPQQTVAEPEPRRTGVWIVAAVAILVLLVAGVGIAGFVVYRMNGAGEPVVAKSPTPSPSATATPAKTPDSNAEDELQREKDKLAREKEKLANEKKALEKQKKEAAENDQVEEEAFEATIIDPPTNIRLSPNGTVLCVIRQKTQITILGDTGIEDKNGTWYYTDACGREGVVHSSQIRF